MTERITAEQAAAEHVKDMPESTSEEIHNKRRTEYSYRIGWLEAENNRYREALERIHAGENMGLEGEYTHADVIQKHYQICRSALV
jgi:hypothetical protein